MTTKRLVSLWRGLEKTPVDFRAAAVSVCSLLAIVMADIPCSAAGLPPGQDQAGFLYRWTHLHPATYLILFLVFVLSAANLVYQGKISLDNRLLRSLASLFRRSPAGLGGDSAFDSRLRGPRGGSSAKGKNRARSADFRQVPDEPREAAIVAVRRVEKKIGDGPYSELLTPLEGVNHPLPEFRQPDSPGTGAPRLAGSMPETKLSSSQFKFSSTVDLPSQEEIERREKEQLAVSGCVKGPDGKGMGSVIVFLTDPEGNRVGQSCRSLPETGEFRVLINEPGKYALNGYKRGFVMENTEPVVLPIESGKIEGYNFKMIPEGCLVQGRIFFETGGETVPWPQVRCVCQDESVSRSVQMGAGGHFRLSGVPPNSVCYIEVVDENQSVLTRSETFETLQKREIHLDIKVPPAPTADGE